MMYDVFCLRLTVFRFGFGCYLTQIAQITQIFAANAAGRLEPLFQVTQKARKGAYGLRPAYGLDRLFPQVSLSSVPC